MNSFCKCIGICSLYWNGKDVVVGERATLRSIQSRFAIYICVIVRMLFLPFDP